MTAYGHRRGFLFFFHFLIASGFFTCQKAMVERQNVMASDHGKLSIPSILHSEPQEHPPKLPNLLPLLIEETQPS
jgi:hypothetical protein